VLPVHLATVRLFFHVLAATVWVGGQLTLAGLLPGLRALSSDAPRTVTSAVHGLLRHDARPRQEFFALTGITR
jgi:uncharacterized membrane protein